MRRISLLTLFALLLLALPASAQTPTFPAGETLQVGVGDLPSGYTTYWVSDVDGYLAEGNTLRESGLSIGLHSISALIYRDRDSSLVWQGSLDVEIVSQVAAAPPVPQSNTSSGASSATYAPGEFEPVSELLLGCNDVYMVQDMYPTLLAELNGVVPTRILVDNRYVRFELEDLFRQTGVSGSDYTIEEVGLDSIWMRDYGPLFVKDRGQLEVVDLAYYPGREYDDYVPVYMAQRLGARVRDLDVYLEGGNYTADGQGNLFTTDVLYEANDDYYARSTTDRLVEDAFEGTLHVFDRMLDDGGTGHLDMFALFTSSDHVFINRFPRGHQNHSRMERHTRRLEGMGYDVSRLDLADSRFSSHSNGLLVNGVAFVPTYGNSRTDAAALQAFRNQGYRTVGVDCRRIIQWSGAIHCITITIPQ